MPWRLKPPETAAGRSQVVLAGGYAARLLLGLLATALLGRWLAPAAFGFYTLVASLCFLAHMLLDLGTGPLIVAEAARSPERELPLLEGVWWLRRAGAWGLAAAAAGGAVMLPAGPRRLVLLGLAATLLLMPQRVLSASLALRQRLLGQNLAGILLQAGVAAGVACLHVLGVPGPHFAWLVLGREALAAIFTRVLGLRALASTPRPGLRGRALGPFVRRALPQAGAVLMSAATFHVDVLLVRWLRGEAELGAYGAAFRPVNPLILLPGLLCAPLIPVLAKTASKSAEEHAELVRGALRPLLGLGALGAAGLLALAPDLVLLLYGGSFHGGALGAAPALRWMGLALGCVFAAAPVTTALLASGDTRALLRLGLLVLLVNVAGNLALVPVLGFTAAAATTACSELTAWAGALWLFRLRWRRPLLDRRLLAALAPAAVLAGGAPLLPGPPLLRVAASLLLGAAGLLVLLKMADVRGFFSAVRRWEAEPRGPA